MPRYNFVQVSLTKDDCLLMINESEASSRCKINKALQLAPSEDSHHLYNILGAVLSASHTLSPAISTTALEMRGETYY